MLRRVDQSWKALIQSGDSSWQAGLLDDAEQFYTAAVERARVAVALVERLGVEGQAGSSALPPETIASVRLELLSRERQLLACSLRRLGRLCARLGRADQSQALNQEASLLDGTVCEPGTCCDQWSDDSPGADCRSPEPVSDSRQRQVDCSTGPQGPDDPPRQWHSLPTDEPFRL